MKMKLRRWFAGESGLGFTFWVTYWLPSFAFNAFSSDAASHVLASQVLASDVLLEAVSHVLASDALLHAVLLAIAGFLVVLPFAMLAYWGASSVACWRAATRAKSGWATAAMVVVFVNGCIVVISLIAFVAGVPDSGGNR